MGSIEEGVCVPRNRLVRPRQVSAPMAIPAPPTPATPAPRAASPGPAPAAGGTVTLYRAVGPNELADIRSFGGFRPDPREATYSYDSGKLFATCAEDAAWWGQNLIASKGKEFAIVEVEIPISLYQTYALTTMDGRPVVIVDLEQLPELNRVARIRLYPYSPAGGQ